MTRSIAVGMLGCAHVPHAMSYARALAADPHARLIGVYDTDPGLAQTVGTRYDAPVMASPEALLDAAEAVVVCSATLDHRPLVELAAARGRHVLCEKPIATTLEDGRAMIDACEAAGVQLHIAFVTRFYPLVQEVRTLIKAGEIGEIVGLVGGNRGRPPLPPQYPGWITDREQAGGGALIDHSVHVTDVMRHVTGLEALDVAAEVDDRFWSAGVDDMAILSVRFDGGAIATVDPSWSVPEDNPWHYDFFLRILGTKGALTIGDTTEAINVVGAVGRSGQVLVPFTVDIDALQIAAFLGSIRDGARRDPSASGEDGIRALEIALAGYASAATATRVELAALRR